MPVAICDATSNDQPRLFTSTEAPRQAHDAARDGTPLYDVVICGAGPVGLITAAQLLRSGLTVKIVDKAAGPLDVGRADAIQPRVLEIMKQLGLLEELLATGPFLDRTILYKDGKQLIFKPSHSSPSEFQFMQVITQPEVEQILIRDIARFGCYVDRNTTLTQYAVGDKEKEKHSIAVCWSNHVTGQTGFCRSRYLVGSDGAHSAIRKSMSIPFDGVATGLVWQILDCLWDTNFPHAWIFGAVLNSEHGGVLIIPRENNMSRLYVRVMPGADGSPVNPDVENAETALARINQVFAPYYVKPAGPIEWYTMWKINERVARRFDGHDGRVFLVGDSAHCHSAAGAYGLNTGCMDAHNLAWKIVLDAKGLALPPIINSYAPERRDTAKRIVQASSCFLRFLCGDRGADTFAKDFAASSGEGAADFQAPQYEAIAGDEELDPDAAFFGWYARTYTGLLTGTDITYKASALNKKAEQIDSLAKHTAKLVLAGGGQRGAASPPTKDLEVGYRTPNPRVFSPRTGRIQRLYDNFAGLPCFNVVLLGGNMDGALGHHILAAIDHFAAPSSFATRYTSNLQPRLFKLHLIVSELNPAQLQKLQEVVEARLALMLGPTDVVSDHFELLLDDQPTETCAATLFHTSGQSLERPRAFFVRPDLWLGSQARITSFQHDAEAYFAGLLRPQDGTVPLDTFTKVEANVPVTRGSADVAAAVVPSVPTLAPGILA